MNKKIKKLTAGKCRFCPCDDYELLDLHRLVPGEDGGRYTDFNSEVCCANCHRKIHTGLIEIVGKYNASHGRTVVIYREDGIEKIA